MSIVDSARKLIGLPYIWGGNYPPLGVDIGTDCSGLCQWAYNDNGTKISRTTYTQVYEGSAVASIDLAVEGDLLFTNYSAPNTPEHVAIYSGIRDGKHYIIEAQQEGVPILEHELYFTPTEIRRILTDVPIEPVPTIKSKKWGLLEWLIYC